MGESQSIYAIKRSVPGMGLGLFAARSIRKGEFIIRYRGERITTAEADRRNTRYLFEFDEHYTIDGADYTNHARYMNHFCNPNVEAVIENEEICFYALRDIETGEELGYDYGEEYVKDFIKPRGCKCPAHRT